MGFDNCEPTSEFLSKSIPKKIFAPIIERKEKTTKQTKTKPEITKSCSLGLVVLNIVFNAIFYKFAVSNIWLR